MRSLIKRIGIAATVGAALLLVAAACSERESPLGRTAAEPGTIDREPLSFDVLQLNDYGDSPSRQIITAYATDEDPSLPQQPMPVLYLLHDWQGDALEFQGYNLQALLSDMYAKGEIGRMMVVTVDASNGLGGSFYRNAGTMGDYEDVLAATIDHVEKHTRAYTAGGRMARAISGHGMGGYGAFRFALDRPEMFGAVSSMSGPLSFGEQNSDFGIWGTLVPQVFTEIDIVPPDAEMSVYPRLAAARHTLRNTALFVAMSGAFSPHPLRSLDSLGML
ncbi:MAG TPA: alpha/beta hydrolase-fold protein, partial [Acidobacteriota bacterium]|nr:alpha/beta hydrolase-fold protein [Acidobacteriota bacterium]